MVAPIVRVKPLARFTSLATLAPAISGVMLSASGTAPPPLKFIAKLNAKSVPSLVAVN